MPQRPASIGSSACIAGALVLGLTGCDRVFQLLSVDEVSGDTGDASADRDSATTDDSSTACLADDFAAPAINEAIWTVQDAAPNVTVSQTSGTLVFSLVEASGVNYALVTTQPRDLTNDAVSIEVVAPLDASTSAELGLSLQVDNLNRYQLFITSAYLILRYSTAGTNSDRPIPYSSTTHRYLRLRHANDMMFWETSPEGGLWTVLRMANAVVPVTNLSVRIFAGTFQLEPSPPGQGRVDNALIECMP